MVKLEACSHRGKFRQRCTGSQRTQPGQEEPIYQGCGASIDQTTLECTEITRSMPALNLPVDVYHLAKDSQDAINVVEKAIKETRPKFRYLCNKTLVPR